MSKRKKWPPLLRFVARGNAKLNKRITTFSLLSGHTCPGAKDCLAKVVEVKGHLRVQNGKDQKFRCFAASDEARYRTTYKVRKHNMDLLRGKTTPEMVALIRKSLPKKLDIVRLHVGGDFFNQAYFDAWLEVARQLPDVRFYAYTKSILYWLARRKEIPENLRLTASMGGRFDDLVTQFGLKCARVVSHPKEARAAGLKIDHTDEMAYDSMEDFALLLHSSQAPNTDAGRALARMRKENVQFAYTRK